MTNLTDTYSLGSSDSEQRRLEEQEHIYGDANFLRFKSTDVVCELGCGSGANLWLASALSTGKYIGVDSQLHQIETCREKVKRLNLTNVELFCADIRQVPLLDNSVSAAFCRLVLIHLPDPLAAITEMQRIVAPGGQVIAIEPEVMTYDTSKPALLKCVRARVNHIYRSGHGSLNVVQELKPMFMQVGLKEVTVVSKEIYAKGSEDKERLKALLNNWLELMNPVAAELIMKGLIGPDDLAMAQQELMHLKSKDYIFLRLWIAQGVK